MYLTRSAFSQQLTCEFQRQKFELLPSAEVRGREDAKDIEGLDDVVGYTLALFGFYTQWQWGFGLPFPLNLIMLPFTLIEWYIRWTITGY